MGAVTTTTDRRRSGRRVLVGHLHAPGRDLPHRLRRFQDAIAAGIDPAALVDVINEHKRNEPPPELSWTAHPRLTR